MALTRDQFDVIANSYNDRQLNNKIKLNRRIEEVYEKIPLIKDLDGQIGVLAGRALRLSLSGNSSAKDTLREDIALISEQKKAALLAGGYSADYLDEIFTCPKCKDTGFIDGKPCECLKAEVVRLLYSRSELKEILERENFDTFEYDLYSDDYIDPDTGISAAENIDAVVDHCHYFINNFDKTFDNLLFYGRAGTGKTFLINCIAKEYILHGRMIRDLDENQLAHIRSKEIGFIFQQYNFSICWQIIPLNVATPLFTVRLVLTSCFVVIYLLLMIWARRCLTPLLNHPYLIVLMRDLYIRNLLLFLLIFLYRNYSRNMKSVFFPVQRVITLL